jgi:hypothetical protein
MLEQGSPESAPEPVEILAGFLNENSFPCNPDNWVSVINAYNEAVDASRNDGGDIFANFPEGYNPQEMIKGLSQENKVERVSDSEKVAVADFLNNISGLNTYASSANPETIIAAYEEMVNPRPFRAFDPESSPLDEFDVPMSVIRTVRKLKEEAK